MIGLYLNDSWRIGIPIRYGDILRLRVPRGLYQVTAWFFAQEGQDPANPTLVAIGYSVIKVMGNRPEKFVLLGHTPDKIELRAILESRPQKALPFRLPARVSPDRSGKDVVVAGNTGPKLEMTSSPLCRQVGDDGQLCPEPTDLGAVVCARHSTGGVNSFQIISWSGTPMDSLFYHRNLKSEN